MPSIASTPETKKAMRLNTVEGAFAVAAENLAAPYLNLFALSLGATPSQIGMLAAFPNFLGSILQIPAGLLAEKMKDKRILPAVGGFVSRISWLALAFLPFLFRYEQRVLVVITLAALRVTAANLGVPAWTALQAVLIPRSVRGRYYANRNVVLNICALLATFVAGYLLRGSFPRNYQIIFSWAAVLGVISTILFLFIPFQQQSKQSIPQKRSFSVRIKEFRESVGRHKDFVSYAKSSLIMNFGVYLASSLFAVHFIETMGGVAGSWAIFVAVNLGTQILFQRYWGRLADIFGQKSVMSVSGIAIVVIPLLWAIAPSVWFPVFIQIVNGIGWGGYNLAAFNLLLEITPDENRSLYVGVYNTLMGLAISLSPLIGGFTAEFFGLRPVFLASGILRALGLFIFYRTVSNTMERQMTLGDLFPRGKKMRL